MKRTSKRIIASLLCMVMLTGVFGSSIEASQMPTTEEATEQATSEATTQASTEETTTEEATEEVSSEATTQASTEKSTEKIIPVEDVEVPNRVRKVVYEYNAFPDAMLEQKDRSFVCSYFNATTLKEDFGVAESDLSGSQLAYARVNGALYTTMYKYDTKTKESYYCISHWEKAPKGDKYDYSADKVTKFSKKTKAMIAYFLAYGQKTTSPSASESDAGKYWNSGKPSEDEYTYAKNYPAYSVNGRAKDYYITQLCIHGAIGMYAGDDYEVYGVKVGDEFENVTGMPSAMLTKAKAFWNDALAFANKHKDDFDSKLDCDFLQENWNNVSLKNDTRNGNTLYLQSDNATFKTGGQFYFDGTIPANSVKVKYPLYKHPDITIRIPVALDGDKQEKFKKSIKAEGLPNKYNKALMEGDTKFRMTATKSAVEQSIIAERGSNFSGYGMMETAFEMPTPFINSFSLYLASNDANVQDIVSSDLAYADEYVGNDIMVEYGRMKIVKTNESGLNITEKFHDQLEFSVYSYNDSTGKWDYHSKMTYQNKAFYSQILYKTATNKQGYYRFVETKNPSFLSGGWSRNLYITEMNNAEIQADNEVFYTFKVSVDKKLAYEITTPEGATPMPQSEINKLIENTTFGLYKKVSQNALPVQIDTLTIKNGSATSKVITYEQGAIYTVKELSVPNDYLTLNTEVATVDTSQFRGADPNQLDPSVTYTKKVTVTNSLKHGYVEIDKIDETGKKVSGVSFELYKTRDGIVTPDEYNQSRITTETLAEKKNEDDIYFGTYTTDENGNIKVEKLEYGDYYWVEVSVGENDNLVNAKEQKDFKIVKDGEGHKVEYTDDWKKGSAILYKIDSYDSNKRLQDATFELYRKDDIYTQYMKDNDLTKDESGIKAKKEDESDIFMGEYTTDEKGEISVKDLVYGKYYWVETKSPYGYDKIDGYFPFEVKGDAEPVAITVTNKESAVGKLVASYTVETGTEGQNGESTEKETHTSKSAVPETSDKTPVKMILIIMLFSIMALAILVNQQRKLEVAETSQKKEKKGKRFFAGFMVLVILFATIPDVSVFATQTSESALDDVKDGEHKSYYIDNPLNNKPYIVTKENDAEIVEKDGVKYLAKKVTYKSQSNEAQYKYDEVVEFEGKSYYLTDVVINVINEQKDVGKEEKSAREEKTGLLSKDDSAFPKTKTMDGKELQRQEVKWKKTVNHENVSAWEQSAYVTEKPTPKETKTIYYTSEDTGATVEVELPYVKTEVVEDYKWLDDVSIDITISNVNAPYIMIGSTKMLTPDPENLTFTADEYKAIIKDLGLPASSYELTGASWNGETYEEGGVTCRKATVTGKRYVAKYKFIYEKKDVEVGNRYTGTATYYYSGEKDLGTKTYTLESVAYYSLEEEATTETEEATTEEATTEEEKKEEPKQEKKVNKVVVALASIGILIVVIAIVVTIYIIQKDKKEDEELKTEQKDERN